jgi:predicted nucleic acid-binding protein
MKIYVESNFILELAFHQEEHESCIVLMELATAKKIELILPTFCLGESYDVWVRRAKRRKVAYETLTIEMSEWSRSKRYRDSLAKFAEVKELLLTSNEEEKEELDKILDHLLNLVEIIPFNLTTIRAAINFQNRHQLSPQDSIVYAAIIQHLTDQSIPGGCFITKNSKDFVTPQIENELATYHCRLFSKFKNALGYIQSQLG